MADGCFVILCGVPASGKSTLTKELIRMEWEIAGKYAHFIYVSYDDFILDERSSKNLISLANWKGARKDILRGLEELVLSNGNSESVAEAEEKCLSKRKQLVSKSCLCGADHMQRTNDIFHVILIDDNMYYRSMRYEYYQLARKAALSFAEVYLHCPIKIALSRNASRADGVAEDTIVKMYSKIEKPDPEKFPWEKHSVTLDTSISQTADNCEMILDLLQNAARNVTPPLKILDEKEKAKDRAITEKNIIHQADQIIRKHISATLERMKENISRDALKQMALSLNQRRRKVMDKMKREPQTIIESLVCEQFKYSCAIDETGTFGKRNVFAPMTTTCLRQEKNNEEAVDKTFDCANGYGEPICNSNEPKRALHDDLDEIAPRSNLDNQLFLENFWDIVSIDEFACIVRQLFEQCA